MKGLLIRVGIDSTDGNWNAPAKTVTREFVYLTIEEHRPLRAAPRLYDEFEAAVSHFGAQMPTRLKGRATHLDPDFASLTYGDQGSRGRAISRLTKGDFLAFFSALRPIDSAGAELVYALIGLYVVEEILGADSVPPGRWQENAHTLRHPRPDEIVVRAKPRVSGRLRRYIPIGEYRDRAYRVRKDILDAWGGIDVKNGYIQRSARPPTFCDAARFMNWFSRQDSQLVALNNP
jgi:hypothetical protein